MIVLILIFQSVIHFGNFVLVVLRTAIARSFRQTHIVTKGFLLQAFVIFHAAHMTFVTLCKLNAKEIYLDYRKDAKNVHQIVIVLAIKNAIGPYWMVTITVEIAFLTLIVLLIKNVGASNVLNVSTHLIALKISHAWDLSVAVKITSIAI